MHIVFVTVELATANNSSGGLASFTANMGRIFAANGHKVTILVVTTKEENLVIDNNIEVRSIYVKKTLWNLFDQVSKICTFDNQDKAKDWRMVLLNIYKSLQTKSEIRKINRKEKIDVIHYCNLNALALFAGKSIPYVIRISHWMHVFREACLPETHIQYADAKLSVSDRLLNCALRKSQYVIAPSNWAADIGKQKFGIKITVIESPFVLNKSSWDDSLYDSLIGEKRYIIHYGSLKYFKGTHVVGQLANELLRIYPDVYLLLAGNNEDLLDKDGEKIKAAEYVKKGAGEFADRVIYAGRLVREQLYPLIENAELCLLPYRMDNLSNACIEAMAMGKIVIGTDGATFEQLIEDRVSGFLCERDNPASYMQAIREAMAMSDEEKETMIAKAKERIKLLSPDVIYKKYYDYYQKVIKEWKK